MKYNIPIKKEDITEATLLILNQLGLNLTKLQLNMLVVSINNGFFVLNKVTRSKLREKLNMDRFTFNNYIKKLKDNKILIVNKDKDLEINNVITNQVKDNEIHITFITNDSETNN